ncbi:MAG: HmuY family protein [Chryseobacterium sp.]|uniref:HmuY family protein n=1 Tax=Chryseobacterium sp. TaxID=1871047 RepID=UPI0025BDAC42|nr:HmuY family protein [Chryseobacterium sp.]MCJ7935436.1 HmuY family protein [Chryseobacterium sp.]
MKKILFYLLLGTSLVSQSCINDNEDPVPVIPSEGVSVKPDVRGAAQPNQVWIDFSDVDQDGQPKQTVNSRTDWDLAFYAGAEFKVVLNTSIMMAAAKIPNIADIGAVKESDVSNLKEQVQVANFDSDNTHYIDDVKGNFPSGYTAIEEIKANAADNAVYLVNLGKELYKGSIAHGSAITGGDERGWMKIQITRQADGYKVRYGDLNAVGDQIKEVVIKKNTAYNYTFFNSKTGKEVAVQPEKSKWDICFSVFTNIIPGAGSYVNADFVTINNVANVGAYEIKITSGSMVDAFNKFKKADVDDSKLVYNEQRVIGGNWREVGPSGSKVKGDVFYIVKDASGFYYKLRFVNLTDDKGERGHPMFQYKAL